MSDSKGGVEEERDAEKDTKDSDGEKQLEGGDEEKAVGGGAGESFVFPLLPYCMTKESLTVIIMVG